MKKRFLALLMTVVMLFQITVITPYSVSAEVTETSVSADGQDDGTDVPVLRAESGLTVLAFTSDTHNQSGNAAANRLGKWIDTIESKHGSIDVMAFGGDMAGASASGYWDLTQADMNQLSDREVTGVYTTGNHEISAGGDFSYSTYTSGGYSSTSTKGKFRVSNEGIEGDNYRIYCLGSRSSSQSYSDSVSSLTSYLNSVGNDKVIFIITHFPLHYYSGRTTTNASSVVDALNNAVTNNGQKIVFLWGHNHTMSDTYYDYIYRPGDSIPTGYGSSTDKTIQFYYGAAGCMSDSEYGSGSASVKGKGLVVTVNSKNQLSFTYYDANGNNVTEGGTFTEQDPVTATAISIDPSAVTVMARKTTKLSVVFTPSDATNQGITWSSSDENIVTVDDTGKIKGITPGSATVTAVSKNGNVSATCQVTVTENTSTGTTYILTDSIEEGGEYLIVSSKADGNAYALRNPGATSSGASLAAAQVTISGETIETEDEDIIWAAETRLSGFELTNGENAILAGKGGTAYIYTLNSDPYADRYWFYDGTYLLYKGGSYTYELYYENGKFTDTSFNSGNPSHPVYIYERVSAPAPVSGVTLDKSTLNIKIGRTGTLTATVLPRNAQNKSVTWSSDNPSVATVSNGVVTGVAKGTATITVETAEGGYTAVCSVNVSEVTGTTYILTDTFENGKKYLIVNGKTGSVYVLSNETGGSRQMKGISAEVEGDSITLEDEIAEKAEFTAEIRNSSSGAVSAWLKNGGKYLYTNNADGLRMVESSEQGSTDNTAKVWHYKADGKDLLWYFKDTSSSDGYTDASQTYKYYLECNNGVFTDNHVSTTSLANTSNLPKTYIFVEDDSTPAPVSGVELDKTALSIKTGRTASLTATVLPRNAQNKSVTWSSSDNAVATVSNGVVTGVAPGTARITVKTVEGNFTATAEVTVSDATGTTYVLTDSIEEGGEYLIVSSKSDGNAYALRNPGGTSGGASLAAAQVTISGETIETEDEDIIWTAGTRLSGFELKNGEDAILAGKGGTAYIYTLNSDPYADRYWFYDGTYLLYKGGEYTYELYYENGFTNRSFNTNDPSHPVFIYVRSDAHVHTYGDPEWIWHFPDTNKKAATRAVEGVTATAVFTCQECGATLEIDADSDSITETVDAVTGDITYTATVKGPGEKTYGDEKVVKADVEKKYRITITADKTMVSPDDTEVTFTLSLSPVEYFGYFQMDIQVVPNNAGLTYKENSFQIAEDLQNTLGFDTVGWSEAYKRVNGYGHIDYSSTEETVLGTFKCTISDTFTGSAIVTIKDGFEVYSADDFVYHSPEYEIVFAEITNHEHVNGEASYEWVGNDEHGYTSVKGCITCEICEAEVVAEEVVPTFEVTTPATCTTAGAGVWTASFTKEGLTNQTKNVEIPVGEHDWEFVDFTWTGSDTDGYTAAVANYKCKNNEEHTQTVTATVASSATTATCEAAGAEVYVAIVAAADSLDGVSHNDSKTVRIEALGHDWEFVDFTWTGSDADGYTAAVANYKCKNDETHTRTVDAVVTPDITAATCEAAGQIVYSASVTETASLDGTAHNDIKTVAINALGHDWMFVDVSWTETEDGHSADANFECRNDNEHKQSVNMTVTSAEGEGSDAGKIVYTATLTETASLDGEEHIAYKRIAIVYTISYELNGGTNPDDAPASYTVESASVALPIPSKEDYGFGGWFEASDFSGNAVTEIATGSTGDKVFYAKWHADACTITWKLYDDNAISTVESYGTAWTDVVKPANPTREGYTFAGWTGNPETITTDLTVTALWTVNQYTITFDTDGGSSVAPITADFGTAITAPAAPTKEGYTFKVWSPEIPETMPAANMTIKATWTANKYAVTFLDEDGETVLLAAAEYDYGTAWDDIVKPEPTKPGYSFVGWDGIPETGTVTGEITVTAKWKLAVSYVMANNVTFEGALTFNAYVALTDEVLADENAYVIIKYTTAPTPSTASIVEDKVYVKDAKTRIVNGVMTRIFTNPFFIAQLHDEVRLTLYSGGKSQPIGRLVDGEIVNITENGAVDSPWSYCDRMINNPNTRLTMVELAKKTKIYGTAAQLHFGYHTEQVTDEDIAVLEEAIAGNSIAEELAPYEEETIGTLPAGITKYAKQIVFEADHALKYHFYLDGSVDISRYTFEVDDGKGNFTKVDPVKVANDRYTVQKANIPSGYLSRNYKFRIKEGTKVLYEITSNGLVYANSIVTKNANPTMVTLVKAMYLYSVAAEEHFSGNL